ncbi:MAG: hypothetical protein ACRDQ2_02945 [Gaiellales bacterium]
MWIRRTDGRRLRRGAQSGGAVLGRFALTNGRTCASRPVLRLRAAGMTERAIAASVGAGATTVHEYLARAEAAGVGWPLPEGIPRVGV